MNSIEQLRSEIQLLEKELKAKKAALKIIEWTQIPTRVGPKPEATRKKMSAARAKY